VRAALATGTFASSETGSRGTRKRSGASRILRSAGESSPRSPPTGPISRCSSATSWSPARRPANGRNSTAVAPLSEAGVPLLPILGNHEYRLDFVIAWTIDDGDALAGLAACGVDGIVTDDVPKLRRVLATHD
jgi:hypothetical protein